MRRLDGLTALRLVAHVIRDPIGAMQSTCSLYGRLVGAEFDIPLINMHQRFVLAIGPRYNERVLGDPATFQTGGLLLPGPDGSAHSRIRSGIVSMNGAPHAHYRRLFLPPFRRPAVDAMVPRMGEVVDARIEKWPGGEIVDLWPLAKDVARHVAIATLFSTGKDGDFAEAIAAGNLVNRHVRMAGATEVRACPINLPGLPYRRMLRHAEKVETALTSWAMKRRSELRGSDLLSLIVHSPDERDHLLDDSRIGGQLLTLFGASYETCQSVLVWTLFLIAQHPAVAARLLDELSKLPAEGPLTAAEIEKCAWLDAVIKESMRLLPPVPFQVRKAMCDTDLVDCAIKGRTRVILSPFLTNRLPELYPDGDRFRPERWSSIDPSPYEYLVFSAGPRTCIGFWFGMSFLKVAVAHILRRYRLSVVPGCRIDRRVAITMWPSRGIPVTIHAQDRRFEASPIKGDICRLVRF